MSTGVLSKDSRVASARWALPLRCMAKSEASPATFSRAALPFSRTKNRQGSVRRWFGAQTAVSNIRSKASLGTGWSVKSHTIRRR